MSEHKEALRQQVILQIMEAFADTPYPGDHNIGWGCGSDSAEFEVALRGQHWKDLTLEFIVKYPDKVPCMTDNGFRFYLPAFMLAVLLHWEEIDTLHINLLAGLTSPNVERTRQAFRMFPKRAEVYSMKQYDDMQIDHFTRKVCAFSPSERGAIIAFLDAYPELFPEDTDGHNRAKRAADSWKIG